MQHHQSSAAAKVQATQSGSKNVVAKSRQASNGHRRDQAHRVAARGDHTRRPQRVHGQVPRTQEHAVRRRRVEGARRLARQVSVQVAVDRLHESHLSSEHRRSVGHRLPRRHQSDVDAHVRPGQRVRVLPASAAHLPESGRSAQRRRGRSLPAQARGVQGQSARVREEICKRGRAQGARAATLVALVLVVLLLVIVLFDHQSCDQSVDKQQ